MELMEMQSFKQTKLGLIPESWDVYSVSEVFEVHNNKRLPISEEVRCKIQGKYPYYGPTKIQDYINEYRFDGTFALIGEDGDHFLKWDKMRMTQLAKGKFNVNNHAHALKGTSKATTEWFYYFFGHRDITPYLTRQGAGRYKLTKATLLDLPCIVPPTLQEQKAIANALSDVDELISNLDQLITKKKAIKQGAMQQLLTPPHKGGKRLAGFTGEWVERKLGDIGEITGAGIDKKIIEGEKTVRLFNYMDVMKRDYVYNHELNHEVTAPYSKIITCNVIEGDIFLTPSSELRTDIGVSAIAIEDMQGVVYSYHLYRLRYNIEINKYYSLYLLKTKQFLDQAEKMCEGSGKRYVVSMGKFRNMIVYLPKDVKEQEAIANILYDMDKEIEQLDGKKAKYQDIKQGMMQELLTGKTRLV